MIKKIIGLAPMDGITDLPYRYIVSRIIEKYNPSFFENFRTWTEFMSAEGFVRNPKGVIKALAHLENDKTPLIAQIYGGDGENLLKTTKTILKKYPQFTGIELNIGCPSPKVVIGGAGAGMMKNKTKTLEIVKKLSSETKKKGKLFSIKTRIGLDDKDKLEQMDFILKSSQVCDLIAVHGRTFRQQHSGEVDRENLQILQNQTNTDCKFIANGGIQNFYDIEDKISHFDGIMVGQSAIGNPWVFTKYNPKIEDRIWLIQQHFSMMMAYELYLKQYLPELVKNGDGENKRDINFNFNDLIELQNKFLNKKIKTTDFFYSAIEFRKYLFNYVKGLELNKEFKVKVSQIKDYEEVLNEVDIFFNNFKTL